MQNKVFLHSSQKTTFGVSLINFYPAHIHHFFKTAHSGFPKYA